MTESLGPDADLETVADALVSLAQVHGSAKACELTVTTASSPTTASAGGRTAGRTKRERKLPAKLTSGDFVCESDCVPVAKTARSSYAHSSAADPYHQLHAFSADDVYVKASGGQPAFQTPYSTSGQPLQYTVFTPSGSPTVAAAAAFASTSKRKQRMPSPSPAYCSQATPTAAQQKACTSYSVVLEGMPWRSRLAGSRTHDMKVKEEQASVIQVYARGDAALHEDGSPVLEAEMVWDSNIYFITRCRAVRGARMQQSV